MVALEYVGELLKPCTKLFSYPCSSAALFFHGFQGSDHFAALIAKSQICMFILPSEYCMTAYSPGSIGFLGQILYSPSSSCFWKFSTRMGPSTTSLVTGMKV